MKNKKLSYLIDQELEQQLPASEIELWTAVRRAAADKYFSERQGETMNSNRNRPKQRLALTGVITIALLVVALLTPQGRALAQQVVQFFSPAERTTFPLEPSRVPLEDPETAPVGEAANPLISLEEAEVQVGFEALQLPDTPDGFEYLGVRVEGKTIDLEYQAEGMGGSLEVSQSREGYHQSDWDSVPVEEIISVMIGENKGEFVQGGFVVYPETEQAVWNPDLPLMRLRWQEGDLYLQITKQGNLEAIEYLDREALIGLAESLE